MKIRRSEYLWEMPYKEVLFLMLSPHLPSIFAVFTALPTQQTSRKANRPPIPVSSHVPMMANGHHGLSPSTPRNCPHRTQTKAGHDQPQARHLPPAVAGHSLTHRVPPWKRERAAYADLCESEFQFKVPGPQGETTLYLETYLYDHAAQWGEKRYEQGLHVQYPGEEYPRPEFFVQMIAYNKDRQRPSTDSKRGEPPIPVLYDSRQAYIIFEDGSRLNARPEVYVGLNDVYDYPSVNERAARPSPYDINSDEVHRMIPKLTNNKRYGSAYVIFQTDKLNADSKWTIHLGSLQVQGRTVAIPPLQLCYHPAKKWIGIEPLMKP